MDEQRKCNCPMRDGGHEWYCGKVGEYEYVHCKSCDKSVWMCSMAMSLCKDCQRKEGVWDAPTPKLT